MKKASVITVFVLILFSLNFVSAMDMEIKSSFYPGETMQVEIPDVFIDNLKLDNIGIYQNNSVHKTPLESGLVKSGDSYFYYANLPRYSGLYTLKIEDANYWEGSVETSAIVERNFSIVATNTSYLSFSPGYLYVTKDFSIVVKAYNKPQDITVSFGLSNFEQKFKIGYGNTKTLYIPLVNVSNVTRSEIKINNYVLPITISPNGNTQDVFNISGDDQLEIMSSLEDVIDFYPEEIATTILAGRDYYYELKLTNEIDTEINDISISASDKEVKLNQSEVSLDSKDSKTISLVINSLQEKDTWINVTYKNYSVLIPVLIKIAKNQSDVDSNVETVNQQKTCQELGGVKCDSVQNQKCSGSETYAFDGWCCMAKCDSSSSSSTWLWGILIIIIVIVAGWFVYDKSQQGQGADKLKAIFQKRTNSYEDRIKPQPPREVRGGLSNS